MQMYESGELEIALNNSFPPFSNPQESAEPIEGVPYSPPNLERELGYTVVDAEREVLLKECRWRPYIHVFSCEQQLLKELTQFRLQSDDDMPIIDPQGDDDMDESLLRSLMKVVSTLMKSLDNKHRWLGDLLESFLQLAYWLRKCETKADYAACVMLSYKLLTGKSVSVSVWDAFKGNDLQADTFTRLTRDARDLFNVANAVKNNPLTNKLKQIYSYLLVQGFLSRVGLNMDVEEYLMLEKKVKPKVTEGAMIMMVIDVALQICERIDSYRLTGDWHALLHDDIQYAKWISEAEALINLSPFTSNLEAHGTTYFKFVADLNDVVERGEAICKYSARNVGFESGTMRKRLNALQLLKNTEITRRATQKERKAPMGVLIHGYSSVGKSSFTKMLFYYFGKVHGLDIDDHFRYVRNPTDEYWSNYDSSKWCIQMDDIAFMLPAKSKDIDSTLKEMLNVCNNVPYVPPQAAIEDKGKTPVMAKLVLATTNAPDLNAHEYFHCPMAVRRRVPFVVHVRPKDEYLHENGKFLDPSKLPAVSDSFPDFWNITVQKLVPTEHHGRDSATLRTVQEFTDVKKFLKFFAEASKKHETDQDSAMSADTHMKDIRVCRLCFETGDTCACLQGSVIGYGCFFFLRLFWTYIAHLVMQMLIWLFAFFLSTTVCYWLMRYGTYRYAVAKCAAFLDKGLEIRVFGMCNASRERNFKVCVKHLLMAGVLLTHCYGTYVLAQKYFKKHKIGTYEEFEAAYKLKKAAELPKDNVESEKEDDEESEDSSIEREIDTTKVGTPYIIAPVLQGNVYGTTEEQLAKEESRNVWYNPTIELCSFDVPVASRSLCHASSSQIRDLFAANCVMIDVRAKDAQNAQRMKAVYLRGQYLLFNLHALKRGTQFQMKIIRGCDSVGVTGNVTCHFSLEEVVQIPSRDVAIYRVHNAPPRKDILRFWNNSPIPATHLLSIRRESDASVTYREIYNAQYCADFPIEVLSQEMPIYLGTSVELTENGDCGSLGVAKTPQGPIVLGLHTVGYQYTLGFPHVTRDELVGACPALDTAVDGAGMPTLALQGDVQLGPIHYKSLFRYMERGLCNVYGTLPGFRNKPRSRVCETPLQKQMLEHYSIAVKHGPPQMCGWEPMYNNVKEMVQPCTKFDQGVLDLCVRRFAQDILSGLKREHGDEWKRDMVFLSDRAAVNGLPGVKYVDRLNMMTSMGHPWHTSKKKYLIKAPDEKYPEGVDFVPEIWERVRQIEACYAKGSRAYPVFTGHLKDEAVTLAKIEAKKTRLFTAAPVDWSIVVRSRLLSFVRLLQKNKILFEAAPGTVAQSIEWSVFRKYLTHFGEDRIVAGDYSKFDKRMAAAFITAAFEIIVTVYEAAGFSEEELMQIRCIGADTAFPVYNLDGVIVEMFGTNPSGHPLTVIINSLVNSLYMRYAYCILNPVTLDCEDFKTTVNLLTYGDDNVMGVSLGAPWFYHGAIQAALQDIGVTYTMADKDSETRPYIHIDECSFLKRSWRYEPELDMYTCPLEEESIHKSLTMWVPSKTEDKYRQMVSVIVSANNEYFFYGREVFEREHKFFQDILKIEPFNIYVSDTTLPGWDELIARFRKASEALVSTN